MTSIVGISGSLRRGSYNSMLLSAAASLAPPDVKIQIASIAAVPLYNGDIEAESGLPDAVRELKERIAAADGLLLATPEYNGSIPGVLKNAIDWLSRPSSDIGRVFGNRPVAVMGATPGRAGTLLSQTAWLQVFRALGVRPWFGPRMMVSSASKTFDEKGQILDETVRTQLHSFIAGFADFIGKRSARA